MSYTRLSGPLPKELKKRIPPTWQYVGETPTGYIFAESSHDHLGDMFSRMFKFTPKSFTMANISRSIYRLTPFAAIMQKVAPKFERQIYQKVAPIAVPIIAGAAAAVAFGPAIMEMLGPKLASAGSMLGTAGSKIGGTLMNFMSSLGDAQQAQVAQQVTPDQIVQMERTGQVPPDLQSLVDRTMAQSYFPPAPPSYQPPLDSSIPSTLPQPPVQAGMFEGSNMWLFLGASALALVLFPQGPRKHAKRRRR